MTLCSTWMDGVQFPAWSYSPAKVFCKGKSGRSVKPLHTSVQYRCLGIHGNIFPDRNVVCISHFCNDICVSHPLYSPPRFHQPNDIWLSCAGDKSSVLGVGVEPTSSGTVTACFRSHDRWCNINLMCHKTLKNCCSNKYDKELFSYNLNRAVLLSLFS
jgi:hypothetical protein